MIRMKKLNNYLKGLFNLKKYAKTEKIQKEVGISLMKIYITRRFDNKRSVNLERQKLIYKLNP